jgi:DNA (cytosine-5)-methyltransferase 1
MKTHLDLFSGIGGFALACRWNNIQTVGFVEYEDYPRRVLSRQFPGVPLFGDIRDFDATPFRGVDLLTGGYPCQPFSQAGKRKGKEDVRHLWPQMFRVVTQARPSWVLAENVAGHINLGLDEVLLDLESEGYTCRTVMVPACAKNALHRRDRVWIIAKRNAGNTDSIIEGEIREIQGRQSDTESRGVCTAASGESRSDVGNPKGNGLQGCRIRDKGSEHSEEVGQGTSESIGAGAGSSSRDVAHSDSIGPQGEWGEDHSEGWQIKDGPTGLCNRARSCNKTEGSLFEPHLGGGTDGLSAGLDFPRRWGDGTWEEGVPRVTTERKNRTHRLKALGNAILPQVAYEIIRCMKEIDESE